MYKLVVDIKKETEKEEKKQEEVSVKQEELATERTEISEEKQEEKIEEAPSQTAYLKSFEGKTLADVRHEEEEKKQEEIKQEKEELIEKQYEKTEEKEEEKPLENIIEKPNYDFIEEKKSIIKIRSKQKKEPEKVARKKGKRFGLFLAIGLGICSVLCVTNVAILDNMSASYSALESEFYNVNLPKYLKNISNLDTTKKSMEFLETYPQEMQNPADLGQKTNWFDKFCNFLSGIFGG